MRTHGILEKWNDKRGFGFVSPSNGSAEIFVHISAFPRDGVRPTLNELISYEIETGHDGKVRAIRIMRPGQKAIPRHARKSERNVRPGFSIGAVFGVLAIAVIGILTFSRTHTSAPEAGISTTSREPPDSAALENPNPAPRFSCDGRVSCSEMTSCEEARYFLQNCPDVKMDGDFDGNPCEMQWCN